MKENNLINKDLLHNFPFLYKYLKTSKPEPQLVVTMMPYISGKIFSIQNESARLNTFYKCISRF